MLGQISKLSLTSALVYIALALLLPEVYPVSLFAMYANLGAEGARSEGAVPLALVGDTRVDPHDYQHFHGDSPDAILPDYRCRKNGGCKSYPCSIGFIPIRAAAWMRERMSSSPPPDAHQLVYKYRIIQLRNDGTLDETDEIVWEGLAW